MGRQLTYCTTRQPGCTAWLSHFLTLAGILHSSRQHRSRAQHGAEFDRAHLLPAGVADRLPEALADVAAAQLAGSLDLLAAHADVDCEVAAFAFGTAVTEFAGGVGHGVYITQSCAKVSPSISGSG